MAILKGLNLALAFILELVMLVAFGYWGFNTGASSLMQWVLGVGAPLIAITIWGIFNAPNSKRRLPHTPRIMLELVMFGLASLALAAAGQITWGVIFFAICLINQVLLIVWKQ